MGFPTKMFTVLFAIGRLPGWIAQWHEMINDPRDPHRPPAPALHRRDRAGVRAGGEALTGFGPDHLPYGVVEDPDGRRIAAVRLGDAALDLRAVDAGTVRRRLAGRVPRRRAGRVGAGAPRRAGPARCRLDAADPAGRRPARARASPSPTSSTSTASEHHAANAGRIFRPHADPLPPNWKTMPVGYHGRSGSVVVSGTPVRRPAGHLDADDLRPERGGSTSRPRSDSSWAPAAVPGTRSRSTTPTGTSSASSCSTTGRPATSSVSSPRRSGRSSASRSRRPCRPGSRRSPRWSTPPCLPCRTRRRWPSCARRRTRRTGSTCSSRSASTTPW